MGQIDKQFLAAIGESFKAYNKKGGARSTKKLIPIHKFISEKVLNRLGKKFSIKSLGIGDGKEATLDGKYYFKDIDIAIFKKEKIVSTISFKFVTSNYKQNANNYFENLMGETANIRRRGVGFAHFLVLRGHTPYYTKNKGNLRGKEQKMEIISEKDLQKYIKLYKDIDFPHKPDLMGICLLELDKNNHPKLVNFRDFDFSAETKKLLQNEFSLSKFLDKFTHLVNLKS
ncbi:MAG: hypothetical protein HW383_235 [Candidatus Magasanikbacteria bacterium]|nr:hypothetical protein [Candidatus Magasanikbacteria bacterium]